MKLTDLASPARMWRPLDSSRVECLVTPRHCKIEVGQTGFCRVRKNIGGSLYSLNYGKATQLTEQAVETEAVFHYAPGANTLALGNVGCMLNCDFCQNWKTSQVRYLEEKDMEYYTPEQVVDIALRRGIKVLAWTYNDPVVWHEFVIDTAKLAQQQGIKNLYKSAFFISPEAAAELCDVVDVFSISIKSLKSSYYKRFTKGWLPPVLEATKLVFDSGKHVEISNLMVTDANDSEEDARLVTAWVLDNLSDEVPLHFVRFHPDYRFTKVPRTPVERLYTAQRIARSLGVRHCYVGNVYDWAVTSCSNCGNSLVERYGLTTYVTGLSEQGGCQACGKPANIFTFPSSRNDAAFTSPASDLRSPLVDQHFKWHGDINSVHVLASNKSEKPGVIYYWAESEDEPGESPRAVTLSTGENWRFAVSKGRPSESGVVVQHAPEVVVQFLDALDRAHYPTQPNMDGCEWEREGGRTQGRHTRL